MSFPNFPNVTPNISITVGQTVPLLLTSIAFEELALAHIMNAEAEKVQFILGTLDTNHTLPSTVTISNILDINKSVSRTLRDVIKKEMLLEFKFENILELIEVPGVFPPPPSPLCAGCRAGAAGNQTEFHVNQGNRTIVTPQNLGSGIVSLDGTICPGCQPDSSNFTFTFRQGNNDVQTFTSSILTGAWVITCETTNTDIVMTITGTGTATGVVNETVGFTLVLTTSLTNPNTSTFHLVTDDGAVDTGVQTAPPGQLQVFNTCS